MSVAAAESTAAAAVVVVASVVGIPVLVVGILEEVVDKAVASRSLAVASAADSTDSGQVVPDTVVVGDAVVAAAVADFAYKPVPDTFIEKSEFISYSRPYQSKKVGEWRHEIRLCSAGIN